MKIFGIHGLLKEHKQQAERGGKSPQKREVATLNAGDKTMGAVIGVWGFLAIVLMFCGIGTVADRIEWKREQERRKRGRNRRTRNN